MERETQSNVEQESKKNLIGGDPYGEGEEAGSVSEETLGEAEASGSLESEDGEADGEAAGEVGTVEKSAVKNKRPVYEGVLKSFDDPNELASYARELEKRQIELEARLGAYSDVKDAFSAKAAPLPIAEEDYAERLFSDPKGVLDEMRAKIRNEIFTEVAAKEEHSAFWDSFYTESPDLRGAEDLVDLILNKNKIKWKDVPLTQAKKLLTTEVRSRISAIRSGGDGSRELTKKTATAVGSSGAALPKVRESETPINFISQMRALRVRKTAKTG